MAMIRSVGFHYERKINTGQQYESARVSFDLYMRLDEEDQESLAEIVAAGWQMTKNNVKAQIVPLKQKEAKELEEIFLGLPLNLQPSGKVEVVQEGDKVEINLVDEEELED
jgi:hypothetical protein